MMLHVNIADIVVWCCAGAEGMSFFFTWMRLSSMKQLDWYRNSSYQSKDIAHVQKTITQRIADKVLLLPFQLTDPLASLSIADASCDARLGHLLCLSHPLLLPLCNCNNCDWYGACLPGI